MYIYDLFTIYHQILKFYTKIVIKHLCNKFLPCNHTLSINIETFAISGISIVIPDIPVMVIFDQLTLIHLNIQQQVSICTSSF